MEWSGVKWWRTSLWTHWLWLWCRNREATHVMLIARGWFVPATWSIDALLDTIFLPTVFALGRRAVACDQTQSIDICAVMKPRGVEFSSANERVLAWGIKQNQRSKSTVHLYVEKAWTECTVEFQKSKCRSSEFPLLTVVPNRSSE